MWVCGVRWVASVAARCCSLRSQLRSDAPSNWLARRSSRWNRPLGSGRPFYVGGWVVGAVRSRCAFRTVRRRGHRRLGHRLGPDSPLTGHRPRERPGPSRQGHHRCAVLPRPRIAHLDRILRTGLLAYFDTGGARDGSTEVTNLLIETTRRTGYGFRNFDNHRHMARSTLSLLPR